MLRDHQSQSFPRLSPQTFRWPTSVPSEYLSAPLTHGSPYGPPVRNFDDFIALQYLQTHHPESLRYRTSDVLSRVNDDEFEKECQRKSEATRRFREKYSSYTSNFEREAGLTPKSRSEPTTSGIPGPALKSRKKKRANKTPRSLVECNQAQYPQENHATISEDFVSFETCQEFVSESFDEYLSAPVPTEISYVECEYPSLQYSVEVLLPSVQTAIVSMVDSPVIIEDKVEDEDGPTILSSMVSDSHNGLPAVNVRPRFWAKVWKCHSLIVSRSARKRRFHLPILRNFKKRRRKCAVLRS